MIEIVLILLFVSLIMVVFLACNKNSKVCYETGDLVSKYEPSELDSGTSSSTTVTNNNSTPSSSVTSSKTNITSSITSSVNSTSGKNETSSLPDNSYQTSDRLPDYNLESNNLKKFQEENRYIKVLTEAEVTDFNSYANYLLATGFTKYDENKINNCQ